MEPRISLVTLGVGDVARSRRFYEALGWKASGASVESTVFFQLGGMALALYGRADLAGDAGLSEAGPGFGGVMLAQNVRSSEAVDALLIEAERAGAQILKAGQKVFWGGYVGYFADPDGYPWEVAWNPGFVLEADGTLRLPD
jgi:catechol 2,3-dioxygenase-like lactoylglutathione lyase family enzyme